MNEEDNVLIKKTNYDMMTLMKLHPDGTIEGTLEELLLYRDARTTQRKPPPASDPALPRGRNKKIMYGKLKDVPLGRRELLVFEVIREWDEPVEVSDLAPHCGWGNHSEKDARARTYTVCTQLERKGLIAITGKTRNSDYVVELTSRGRKIKYHLTDRGNYEMGRDPEDHA